MKRNISNILNTTSIITSFILFHATMVLSQSQGGEWTWITGDNTTGTAVYGTQGTPSVSNKPPGLMNAICWTGLNGKFWLYGGGVLSPSPCAQADLWMFDSATLEWTWISGPGMLTTDISPNYGIQGVSSPTNHPGSRYRANSWTDNNGNLWLFGGLNSFLGGSSSADYGDLWKYDIVTNEWTWMKGSNTLDYLGSYGSLGVSSSTNNPSCRDQGNASWVDNAGDLWLFGGKRFMGNSCSSPMGTPGPQTDLNDLWKYNINSNEWTWMHGANTPGDWGDHGILGVASPNNRPSARATSWRWKDNSGNLWLFGGHGLVNDQIQNSSTCWSNMNDLWKYDVSTNMWTWMNGGQHWGELGTMSSASCSPNNSNLPSTGMNLNQGVCMTDNCGNFWFYGNEYGQFLPDANVLWMYNPNTNQWSWSGNTSGVGNYGTQGVSSALNNPPYRAHSALGWADQSGNLWMGFGVDGNFGELKNDMWKFSPDYCSCVVCNDIDIEVTASDSNICGGSTTLMASGANSYTWSPATGLSATTGANVTASPTVTTTYTVIGTIGNCLADTTTITIVVNGQQSADFSYDDPFCQSDVNPFPILDPGSSAGTFTSTAAGLVFVSVVTGEVDLSGSAPGTYTVTNTVAASGSCPQASATATITVNAFQDASFNYSNGSYCQAIGTALPIISGVVGGSFSAAPTGLLINSTTGEIDLSSPANTYVVTYATSGSCGDTETFTVTISTGVSANFSYAGPYCANEPDPSPTISPGSSTGTFSSSPAVLLNATTGVVDLSASTPGTYTVTNTVAANGSCPQISATATITINALQDASFDYGNSSYCQSATTALPIINGATGGTFTATPVGLIIDPTTGEIDLSGQAGTYTITYTTAGICAASSSQVVQITNSFIVNVPSDVICEGETTTLTAIPSVSGGTYSWNQNGQTSSSIDVAPTQTTTYTVTYTLNGCTASGVGTIIVNPAPNPTISTPYTTISEGETIFLTAGNADGYLWSSGQTQQVISVSPEENTTYCVVVTDNGCSDSTCIDIQIGCESVVYAPNCITANGDKTNDEFIIQGDCLSEYHLMIFNRWGELIFETFDIAESWDGSYKGKPVSDGVYTYLIYARGADNIYYDKHGFVTVLK